METSSFRLFESRWNSTCPVQVKDLRTVAINLLHNISYNFLLPPIFVSSCELARLVRIVRPGQNCGIFIYISSSVKREALLSKVPQTWRETVT